MSKYEFPKYMCDKCGEEVPFHNSAKSLQELLTEAFLWVKDRHLYPTETCEGSPSRVDAIENDLAWWKAYRELQEEAERRLMP